MHNVLAEGYQLHRAGKLKQAAQRYKSVLKTSPHNPDALMLLGLVRYELGEMEQAVKYLSKAVKVAPNNPGAHFNLGLAHQARGRLQDAADAFAKTLALTPGDMNAEYCLGAVSVQLGLMEDGKRHLTKAQPAMMDNPGIPGWLGIAHQAQGNLKAALQSFERALDLDPDNLEALYGLAAMPATSVRPQAAFDYAQKAATLAPDNIHALLAYATWLEKRRRIEDANTLLSTVLKKTPRHPTAHLIKAKIEFAQGKFESVRDRLQNLTDRDDISPAVLHEAFAVLGKALDKLGAYEQAFAAFDRKNTAMRAIPQARALNADLVPNVIRDTRTWLTEGGG